MNCGAEERRRYLFALADGGGTVPPELGVARRLVDRGHDVRVLGELSIQSAIRSSGAAFTPWRVHLAGTDQSPAHLRYRDWEFQSPIILAQGMADHLLAGPARTDAHEVLGVIDEERPDIVVTSFTAFGAMAAAESAELPFDVLIPNIYPLPTEGAPPMGTGWPPARTRLEHLRDRAANTLSTRLMGHFVLPRLNSLRTDLGLPSLREHWDQVRAARRQFVLTSRHFEFPVNPSPSVCFTGPVLDEPVWASDETWSPPECGRPLVLATMSSTSQGQLHSLQRIIDALAGLPVHGLVTTGPGINPVSLRGSLHVDVVKSVPHREVMRKCDLVITHGGHGTVMKSLVAGVPMVVIPHGRDQPDNAVRVTTRGAGVSVSRSASVSAITDAVRTVLSSDAFTQAAERLGAAIRTEMAASPLVSELENL